MADLYLVALSKKRGDESRSSAMHYLISKEATRCLPCGDVVCGAMHPEAEQLAECIYYLSRLHYLGKYGSIQGARNILKARYEEASLELCRHEGLSYRDYQAIDDEKLNDYQDLVNEMDLKYNPFIGFADFVRRHRIANANKQAVRGIKRPNANRPKQEDV